MDRRLPPRDGEWIDRNRRVQFRFEGTTYEGFDGFPMFSHDGKTLVFASNRFGKVKGDTNIFIADWK